MTGVVRAAPKSEKPAASASPPRRGEHQTEYRHSSARSRRRPARSPQPGSAPSKKPATLPRGETCSSLWRHGAHASPMRCVRHPRGPCGPFSAQPRQYRTVAPIYGGRERERPHDCATGWRDARPFARQRARRWRPGTLPGYRIDSNVVRFDQDELDDWLRGRRGSLAIVNDDDGRQDAC